MGGGCGVTMLKECTPLGHLLLGRLGLSCLSPAAAWDTRFNPLSTAPAAPWVHRLGGWVLAQLHDTRVH